MIEFGIVKSVKKNELGIVEAQVELQFGNVLELAIVRMSDFYWEPNIGESVACAFEANGKGVVLGSLQDKLLSEVTDKRIAREGDSVQVGAFSGSITSGSSNAKLL